MPRFPEYIIQEVLEKNNIVDVVSPYVKLKKSGSSYIGLCPFHSEKTPSFSVSEQKNIYHCFGCGEGGTAINFIMKMENVSFVEALENLAERANVVLPKANNFDFEKNQAIKDTKETIYKMNEDAAKFFYEQLKTSEGIVAIDYIKKRELNKNCVRNYWIGYAPNSWDKLFEHLKGLGYIESDILKAGLISQNDSNKFYDKFRNRLMFPIFNINNRIIGFGGRVLDDSKPKYLNSPETLVFNKSKNLFSLNIAKASKKSEVILVEGYMDVIALAKSGFTNSVATLGTALTSDQARILKKYFKEVILCYDSDEAGQNAIKRAITVLREFDIKISVISLGDKKDPDEYIKAYGKDRFAEVLSRRKADIVYLMDIYGEKYDLSVGNDKVEYVSDMMEYLNLITNSVELDVYVNMLSKQTGVTTQALYMQLNKESVTLQKRNVSSVDVGSVRKTAGNSKFKTTQQMLLSVLIYNKETYFAKKEQLTDDMFDGVCLKVYDKMKYLHENDKSLDINSFLSEFNEDEVSEVTKILSLESDYDDTDKAANDFLKIIQDEKKKVSIIDTLNKGDVSELNRLLKNQ